MKLAVIGSRTFNDYPLMEQILLDYIAVHGPVSAIISGGAKGADTLAEKFAEDHSYNLKLIIYPADWFGLGKSAGFVRNQQIVDACDSLIAFWDGKSPGTHHAIIRAAKMGKEVSVIKITSGS